MWIKSHKHNFVEPATASEVEVNLDHVCLIEPWDATITNPGKPEKPIEIHGSYLYFEAPPAASGAAQHHCIRVSEPPEYFRKHIEQATRKGKGE